MPRLVGKYAILAILAISCPGCPKKPGESQMTNEPPPAVLSQDFATASQALDDAVKNRDADVVSLALGHRTLILRCKAAEALARIGDKASVPKLVDALEDNQAVQTGGAETAALQIELNAALILALKTLTEADFAETDASSKEDVQRVLRISREWLQKRAAK